MRYRSLRLTTGLAEQLRHPHTGLMPLGFTSRGPVWPVIGASETPPEPPTGGDEVDQGGSTSSDDTGTTGGSGSDEETGGAGGEPADTSKTYTASEYEAIKARMQSADRRASEAERKAKSYEDKDKTELQRATDRVTELETQLSGKDETIGKLRVRNAFLSANDYSWHDPDVALSLVNLETIESDDDGNPTKKSMSAALKAVATEHGYLVKTTGNGTGPSGTPGPKRAGANGEQDEKAKRERMRKRFPSIGR